tara:strand:+ start:246 stop:500 length:255 start_codon:yes stop_codon:yes gene_type:complete
VVTGTVSISIKDFQDLVDSKAIADDRINKTSLATKELQVFLSFLCTRSEIEKYVNEFNRQSKMSKIVFEGTVAKIEFKDEILQS